MATQIAIDIFVVFLLFAVGQTVVSILLNINSINDYAGMYSEQNSVLLSYIVGGLTVAGGLLAIMHWRKISFSILHLKKPTISDFGYAVLGYGTYLIFLIVAYVFIYRFVPGINLGEKQDLGLNMSSSGLVLVPIYIALAITPAISEELLFRGFLYNRLRHKKLGGVLAAFITSIIFAFMHGQVNVAVDTFILSMIMIYVFDIRKNLWVTIFMHLIKNTVAFVGLFVIRSALG